MTMTTIDSVTTRLDFLRHGEPVGGRKYRGQTDDPLSEKGWAEMREAVSGARPWQHIVTSPLARCRTFAETLAADSGVPLHVETRFREVGFGDWEGRTAAELRATDPGIIARFKRDPVRWRPPGAEDLSEFHARVATAFDDLVREFAGAHVLVVAHAGVIRMAACHVLHLAPAHAYRIQVASAAMLRFSVETGGGEDDFAQWLI